MRFVAHLVKGMGRAGRRVGVGRRLERRLADVSEASRFAWEPCKGTGARGFPG